MTQLLQEMIELNEERQLNEHISLLLEYLGNLAVIDKSLVRSLTKANYNYGSSAKKAPKLGPKVGQKSKVEKKVASGRNGDQLWKYFDDNKDILAMVLQYDDKQIMAISDKSRTLADPTDASYSGPSYKDASNKPTMYIVATDEFFDKVMPQEEFDKTFAASYDRRGWRAAGDGKSRELKGGALQARTFVRKLLDMTVKKAREEKVDVTVLFIYGDAERAKTQGDRRAAQAGREPTPKDDKNTVTRGTGRYTQYIKDLKSDLKRRLDKYKSEKAKGFKDQEELLKHIRDEGILDKLKLGEYSYDMYQSRIYFDDMLKKARGKADNWTNESYVEYRITGSLSKLCKQIEQEVRDANPGVEDKELFKEVEKAYAAKLPPTSLKVMYAMKGGMIVPVEVKGDGSHYAF